MMDDLSKLRQLIELEDTGNYRKAAANLGISHSALSQTVNKMEERYGVMLFTRNKLGTVPTVYGRRILDAARSSVEQMDRAERELSMMQALEIGRLIVGIDPNLSEGLLAPALVQLLTDHPKLQFTVLPRNWRTMDKDLMDGVIDMYIGLAPDREVPHIDYREFKIAQSPLICRSGHPLLDLKDLKVEDLFDYPFIGGDVPDWFLKQITDQYPNHFPTIDSLREMFLISHEIGLLRKLIPATDAVGFIAESTLQAALREGRAQIVPGARHLFPMDITGVIATKDNIPLAPAAQKLSRLILGIADIGYRNWLKKS
ncbi:LysR family transcriptional regulator [Temperatibacter marinus]|uniref:LysR family transcriptional regulator n=1 Tax=Temperatibacter marinus TaxID=1456591 RepID=A0AA52HAV6_9PROT|nr:LysR family transcriptional regulator [Temperatibacter marinus]WND03008.1 LysR family transcriptional regulator [Temperatibacter marinus]